MENNLSLNESLVPLLKSWKELHGTAVACADGDTGFPAEISGLKGSLPGFFVAQFLERRRLDAIHEEQYGRAHGQPQEDCLIIVPSQKEADECETDLNTILGDSADVLKLPWWGMLPYRPAAKGSSVFGERAGVLAKLASPAAKSAKPRIFVITQRALLTPVPPPSYVRSQLCKIRKGQSFDSTKLAATLAGYGYIRVPRVSVRGEFALRGEVLDIFMPGEQYASRIVFDFDTVEQIKTFDTETQSSKGNTDSLLIYPMKEVLWTDELCAKLEQILQQEDEEGIINTFAEYDARRKSGARQSSDSGPAQDDASAESRRDGAERAEAAAMDGTVRQGSIHLALTDEARQEKERLLTELSVQRESEGEELFYGVLWDKFYSVLDYTAESTTVFFYDYDRLCNAQKLLRNEYDVSYRTMRQKFPVLLPSYMLFDFDALAQSHGRHILFRSLETMETLDAAGTDSGSAGTGESSAGTGNAVAAAMPLSPDSGSVFHLHCEAPQSFFGNINYFKEQLSSLQQSGWHIFIFADNPNQALRIREVVRDYTEQPEDRSQFPVHVFPQAITEGFSVSDEKVLVIQESEIFGRRKAAPKSIRRAKSRAIDTFVELTPGDYVVHVNYGIGMFKGIERVKSMGMERDYIKLEYADQEFAFVPIEQVNMVQRYIGSEGEKPRLDRIGSKSWSSRKAKVQQKVEEIAEKLIDLYSKRKASRGFAFPKDSEWQAAFEAAFPYEDTPDQFAATQDIKSDMERPVPMDRLVCGDVGYGKTEIAMRAAFKAVMGGKQVAFLAPTTILAEQHYENCIERFRNFPVQISMLSRFVSPAEQKKVLARLAEGKVDILIGTHRIIQKDVVYKDLGLMIIDEEQRFGVKDKEKLKVLKTNIDSLAMSATPIPRTLHMSLLKIRDMSLLTTPPQNRQPIETAIEAYSDEKIATAIRREVERGGQVFYLHNRVETLEETRIKLEHLVPEMMVDVAHGKMSSEQLDDIFRRFKMGGFNVLVATTIIENGIDIPNVNTIIIDRADMYGVSQLYQLRGRVGRSDRKAYAYLFYPENKALSEVAMKRLQVISDFTELGSGFKIAMKDMEIRGAGNLLGRDQSGEVYAVGFEMYLTLLNAAIERLSSSDWHAPEEVLLELEYTGFIPDNYVPEAETKMEMYKKIASIGSQDELDAVYDELYDRFGPVPDEVNSLLSLAKIRIICNRLAISSLKEKQGMVRVEFGTVAKVNIDKILRLIKTSSGKVMLDAMHPNQLMLKTDSIDLSTKSDFIKEKLEQLV
ncbi:MAG: transcription-repair coupling factor [Treponema sp.]|nr:transcription-repair coupling factor [Treponema sp.]